MRRLLDYLRRVIAAQYDSTPVAWQAVFRRRLSVLVIGLPVDLSEKDAIDVSMRLLVAARRVLVVSSWMREQTPLEEHLQKLVEGALDHVQRMEKA